MFVVNVEGAIYRGEHWLLIKRSTKEEQAGGLLSLVGGTVEKEGMEGDVLQRTLRRELFEEVGAVLSAEISYVQSASFSAANGTTILNVVFLSELGACEPFVKSPEEVDAVCWLTTEEILQQPDAPIWLKESIQAAANARERRLTVGAR